MRAIQTQGHFPHPPLIACVLLGVWPDLLESVSSSVKWGIHQCLRHRVVVKIKGIFTDKTHAWFTGLPPSVGVSWCDRKEGYNPAGLDFQGGHSISTLGSCAPCLSHRLSCPSRCCQTHDCCYEHLKLHRCRIHTNHYDYTFSHGDIQCCECPGLGVGVRG